MELTTCHNGLYLSKDSDVRVSCQTTLHQSLRRIISFDWVFGGVLSRLSLGVGLCRPSDWARRHVSPIKAQEASAFISLRRTKQVKRRAWIESNEGL